MSVRQQLGPGVGSLEELRAALGLPRPTSLRNLLEQYAKPIDFDNPLVTPDGVAIGGRHTIHLERNGTYRYAGHTRATGVPSYNYSVRTVISSAQGNQAIVAASGRVHGSNEFGDRVSSWNQTGWNPLLTLHWLNFKQQARIRTEFNRDVDWFGDVGTVLTWVGELAGGAALAGGAGVCLVLGVHGAEAAGLSKHVGVGGLAGVIASGTFLLVYGPGALIPALVVGAAVGVAVDQFFEHRQITEEEYRFADKVFGGTLPRDRIVLTNMLGFGNRPFTIPSIGNTILVNLGAGFTDPVNYTGLGDPANLDIQAAGQLFIHELTHAWQIDTSTFLPGMLCGAVVNQSTTIDGDMSVYHYGSPSKPWDSFNLEQQASIVEDWFAGSGRQGPQPMSESNPYFRYIRDNIRVRIT